MGGEGGGNLELLLGKYITMYLHHSSTYTLLSKHWWAWPNGCRSYTYPIGKEVFFRIMKVLSYYYIMAGWIF